VRARIVLEQAESSLTVAPDAAAASEARSTRLLLRVNEVAEALALSRSTVYELIRSGEIKSIRIGRATRVSTEWLRDWIREQHG
jgi:excisionase family DNA binding protein